MRRFSAPGIMAISLALCTLFGCSAASADSRTEFLVGRLGASDFRVRTNAALALGASNDEGAVTPLCDTLADDNEVVRQAAAVALRRLARPSSIGCLKRQAAREQVASVKVQMTRALEAASAAEAPAPSETVTTSVANAKYYVSISPVQNPTGRPQDDVEKAVVGAIRQKLLELGAYQVAPPHETPDAAKALLAKRKLKGYYLSVGVDKFDYGGGNLRVKVKLAVFTYPTKNLRGEIPAGVSQSGVRAGDRSAEDDLMGIAAARCAELFAQNFQ